MSRVLVFDLDDTLYDERTYVESGLLAVATWGAERFGWEASASLAFTVDLLDREGRGAIFDRWLAHHGRSSRVLVAEAVRTYRHHRPSLTLAPEAAALLPRLAAYPLYLVTDGHKIVQQHKVEALGIAPFFRRVFITHRHGIRHAKPSLHCFERIRQLEGCLWSDLVYVGDNPAKDFVALNAVGAETVRVRRGIHAQVVARSDYDARHTIDSLAELPHVLSLHLTSLG